MKQFIKQTILLLIVFNFTTIKAQKVTNVQPKLVGNNMEITYEITGAEFNQSFTVLLYVSFDGGKTFQGPMSWLSGDRGKDVKGGENKLVWDVFKDVNSLEGDLVFDIRAKVIEEEIKRSFFIQYSAGALISSSDYITPLGIRVGMVGKTGWYAAGYFNNFKNTDYNYDGETMDKDIFYEFTDKTIYPRMVITAGLTYQLGLQSFVYAGAGYVTKKYFTQITELNPINQTPKGEHWVNMTQYEESGVEIEAGALLNFGKFSTSLGISTFNFKHIGTNIGIGIVF